MSQFMKENGRAGSILLETSQKIIFYIKQILEEHVRFSGKNNILLIINIFDVFMANLAYCFLIGFDF